MNRHKFQGIYLKEGRRGFYTKSFAPGKNIYGENVVREGKDEYREWNVMKSKLGAALAKGISQIGIKPGDKVLYLGASTGTTPSHVSDIVGREGFIFALDFAPRVVRELVFVCQDRTNMAPLLGDAKNPDTYYHKVSAVDAVYQDIAQKDQAEILLKNCKLFLKRGGFAILAVKARSIDVSRRPRDIFKEIRAKLEKELILVDYRELDPFEKDHALFVCKKR